jgi:hypothetical protein
MKSRETILRELREISPMLAEMEPVNVFSVPDGYFESLTDNISAKLTSLQPSFGAIKQMPQSVPANYFEDLSNRIITRIRSGSEETEMNIGRQMPNDVPAGYFEELSGNILSRIKKATELSASDEIASLSPALSGISRQMPNDVPAGYFEKFAIDTQKKAAISSAKTISLFSFQSWARYAAAAVMIGVVSLTAIRFMQNDVTLQNNTSNDSAEISEALSKVSDLDLQQYATNESKELISAPNVSGELELDLATGINENKLQEILQQLPDEAINDYAIKNSTITIN